MNKSSFLKIKNLFFITFAIIILSGCIQENTSIEWGDAPNINLKTIDGENFNLSNNLGKLIIIDFMYVSCPPCKLQMEELKIVYNKYSEEIVMISISVLGAGDTNNDLKNFKEYYEAEWIFAIDTLKEDATMKYNVLNVPNLIIIDKEGNIAFNHVGLTNNVILIEEVNSIIQL